MQHHEAARPLLSRNEIPPHSPTLRVPDWVVGLPAGQSAGYGLFTDQGNLDAGQSWVASSLSSWAKRLEVERTGRGIIHVNSYRPMAMHN